MTNIVLPVHQERAEGLIGASDAAAALGLDRYRPPIVLWRQLRGLPTNDERPAFVQEAAEFGQLLEPVIRGKYALMKRVCVAVPETSILRGDWLRATPDGLVLDPRVTPDSLLNGGTMALSVPYEEFRRGVVGLLQVKTCSAYLRDQWEDSIPAAYEVQVRVEMAVTELPWCDVVCLVGGQQMRGPFRIERNLELEANILRDLRAFWDSVKAGVEPAVDGSEAWRQYASDRMRPTPVVVMLADDETNALVANWLTARNSRKALEAVEEQHKTELLLKLSAAGATKINSRCGMVTSYRTGARTDWKAYAISLGGASKPPEAFKGEPGRWTVKAPKDDEE